MSITHELLLPGLDGSNPLAFLAALGTLRMAARIYPGIKTSWTPHTGHWRPQLRFAEPIPQDDFTAKLHDELQKMRQHPVLTFSQNLKLNPMEFRRQAKLAVDNLLNNNDAISHTFFCAFGCEATVNEQGDIQDTAFRTMSGAGHQHFLKTMADLVTATTREQINSALFESWTYPDEKIGLRWDPSEDKRYALAWRNPSQDATMTQRGANRLALEALPLFPTAPMGKHLETTGFTGHKSNDTFWTWPIWNVPLNLDAVRSLLAHPPITKDTPSTMNLHAQGIACHYRSQRITTGKFRNFTPAIAIA